VSRKLTLARDFTSRERSVVITTARLRLPLANVFLLLHDKDSEVRLAVSLFARRRLRRALRASGVSVDDQASWRAPRLSSARGEIPVSPWHPD
jgi:hypothetical protein